MTLGIFYEILMRWVGEVESLCADTRIVVGKRKSPEKGKWVKQEIPDTVNIIGRLKRNGAVLNFMSSNAFGNYSGNECRIYGSEGTLHINLNKNIIHFGKKNGKKMELINYKKWGYPGWRVEQEFIGAVRGEEKVKLTTFEDGLKYMVFTDAVHVSSMKKKWVVL